MKIKRILISQAEPEMIVAEDIYTYNNQLIISKDTKLTNRAITRLNFYSITDLKVYEEPVQPVNDVINISFREQIRRTSEYMQFNNCHSKTVELLKNQLNSFINKTTDKINIDLMMDQITDLISQSRNGVHVFHMLQCMRDFDDLTFVHSVNVALICHTMGTWFNLDDKDLEVLTLGGLLHDIGKLLVPPEILDKPDKLTDIEYRIIKTHSQKGYDLLQSQPIDMRISMCALMHHERCDGSGYPNRLKSNDILFFPKIVAIADTYDAMTSARLYRSPMCPFEVINIYETEGLQKFDPNILLTFLHDMAQTYIHNDVLLNDGRQGKIVMLNRILSRPVIQIEEEFIDLSKELDLSIVKVL